MANIFGNFLAGQQAGQGQQYSQRRNALLDEEMQQQTRFNALSSNPKATPEDYARLGRTDVANSLTNIGNNREATDNNDLKKKVLSAEYVLRSEDPTRAAIELLPDLVKMWETEHGPGSFQQIQPDHVRHMVQLGHDKMAAQAGIGPPEQFNGSMDYQKMQFQGQQDEQQAAQQHRYRLGEIGAQNANKPPPSRGTPVRVAGPDGKPVWAYPDEAVGQPAFSEKGGQGAPLPVGALKIVDEAKQSLGAVKESGMLIKRASAILKNGKVDLGFFSNAVNRNRNRFGASSPESRAYSDMLQTFEKLRNNYLLLAKGVQTEGDATRAWNSEIGESAQNDNKLALQQLNKAHGLIENMSKLQQGRIDQVYSNYGASPPEDAGKAEDPLGIR